MNRNAKYRARALRRMSTPAEQVLWEHLRDRRIDGVKFRRQHPVGPFYVDFCAPSIRLVVEADGEYHAWQREHDRRRDAWLRVFSFEVLHVSNDEILGNTANVIARIRTAITRARGGL
jgi:very-short-patch-repair endonuclease